VLFFLQKQNDIHLFKLIKYIRYNHTIKSTCKQCKWSISEQTYNTAVDGVQLQNNYK